MTTITSSPLNGAQLLNQNQNSGLASSPWKTVKQFSLAHPAFTESAVRFLIFNEKTNGLASSGALVRNGRRIIINETKFFRWLEARGSA